MDMQNISSHSPFIYKPTQNSMTSKYQNTTLIMTTKSSNQPFPWFSRLAIGQEYPRETDRMLTINLAM